MALSLWDYLAIGLYAMATLGIGFWVSRRMRTGRDFFLAGRSLPWWAAGMSLVATDIGGTDILGVGGAAYRYGLAVANFEWIGCVPAMIVAAFVFVPHFWKLGISTIPEFFERRFHRSLRWLAAACWLVFMACNLGVMLFASGKMLVVLLRVDFSDAGLLRGLAGQELAVVVVVIGCLVGSYTAAGGLAAVVYTDVLQLMVMIGGCLAVLILAVLQIGGWSTLVEHVQRHATDQHWQLVLPVDTPTPFPWTGIFFGLALVLSPAYWFGNQAIVQRSLGVRSAYEAKAAYVWGALLKNLIPVIIALPGLAAVALFPNLADGDEAYPRLAAHVLPVGFRGVFLAAFVAALMSSVDSYLNSAATIVVNDFARPAGQAEVSPAAAVRLGRIVTGLLTLWGILFSLWLSRLEGATIYGIFQTLMSFFQGPALAVLLAGVLWSRATASGALCGFIVGLATSILLFVLNSSYLVNTLGFRPLFRISEPYLYYSFWSFLVAMITLILVSWITRPAPLEQIHPLLYSTKE